MRESLNWTKRCSALLSAALLGACASGGRTSGSPPSPGLSFAEAWNADSSAYEPATGFRAVAEPEWLRAATGTAPARAPSVGSWRLSSDCLIRFGADVDVLAAGENPPAVTRPLRADECRGHAGFWQQSGSALFWWMSLGGEWSAEFHARVTDDSTIVARRYALRRTGPRAWRAERRPPDTLVVSYVPDPVVAPPAKPTFALTTALRAIGETDWATRPGAGTARAVGGTRWREPSGCTLNFTATVLARATRTQRLTRSVTSTSCDGLRGSWQQVGKRVFWRVNLDSTRALEIYADITSDTLMRTREYELLRESARQEWTATWNPQRARTLVRVRR